MMKIVYTLDDLRNWREVSRDVEPPIRLGVFGDPVEHSLSPQMQNAALRHCGIEMRYARFHIKPGELAEAFERISALKFVGLNLTVPHKVAAMEFLDSADEEAALVGAVNTLRLREDKLAGFNTDGLGFVDAIAAEFSGSLLAESNVLILGAGGAAHAIAAQCVKSGSARVFMCNRTRAAADDLVHRLKTITSRTDVVAIEQSHDAIEVALKSAKLVVNATTVGLQASDTSLIDADMLNASHVVYDTIYKREGTALLRDARAAGAGTANGLSMLLHQGARAFQLWFDRDAPIDVMRRALDC